MNVYFVFAAVEWTLEVKFHLQLLQRWYESAPQHRNLVSLLNMYASRVFDRYSDSLYAVRNRERTSLSASSLLGIIKSPLLLQPSRLSFTCVEYCQAAVAARQT